MCRAQELGGEHVGLDFLQLVLRIPLDASVRDREVQSRELEQRIGVQVEVTEFVCDYGPPVVRRKPVADGNEPSPTLEEACDVRIDVVGSDRLDRQPVEFPGALEQPVDIVSARHLRAAQRFASSRARRPPDLGEVHRPQVPASQ